MRLGHVAVPVPHRDAAFFAEWLQALELVINEGFQGADVDTAYRGRRILGKEGQDGKKGGFRLTGSRRCREQ